MKLIPLLTAAAVLSPMASSAVLIYGLTTSNSLISFDSATPAITSLPVAITQPGIVDIDFYPANGLLYGMTNNGDLYRINTTNGTTVSAPVASGIVGATDMDFNPSADRARIFANGAIGADNNFRLVPDVVTAPNTGIAGTTTNDGSFGYPSGGGSPFTLVGSAYSNNFDSGGGATTLFSIDFEGDRLFSHSTSGTDPLGSFNTLTLVGSLGFNLGTAAGFDIDQSGNAWVSNGNAFYSLALGTGAATFVNNVNTPGLLSIAAVAVPEASTTAALVLAGLCVLRRRRS